MRRWLGKSWEWTGLPGQCGYSMSKGNLDRQLNPRGRHFLRAGVVPGCGDIVVTTTDKNHCHGVVCIPVEARQVSRQLANATKYTVALDSVKLRRKIRPQEMWVGKAAL